MPVVDDAAKIAAFLASDRAKNDRNDNYHICTVNSRPLRNRYPLTGTIDQKGDDIRGMKDIGVDHIIFDSSDKII